MVQGYSSVNLAKIDIYKFHDNSVFKRMQVSVVCFSGINVKYLAAYRRQFATVTT